jgi:hypothetical protein
MPDVSALELGFWKMADFQASVDLGMWNVSVGTIRQMIKSKCEIQLFLKYRYC